MRTQQVCVEWNKGRSGARPAVSGGEWVIFQDCSTLQPPNRFGMEDPALLPLTLAQPRGGVHLGP